MPQTLTAEDLAAISAKLCSSFCVLGVLMPVEMLPIKARSVVIDTTTGTSAYTFDGREGELVVYRRSGSNTATVQLPSGLAWAGGGTVATMSTNNARVTCFRQSGLVEVIATVGTVLFG